jgi:cation-transporting ATPase E
VAAITTFAATAIVRGAAPPAEVRSVSTLALWIVAFWILCVLSRPLVAWRLGLLAAMLTLFILAVTVPFASDFFAMHLSWGWPTVVGIVAGSIGAVGIEAVYRIAKRRGLVFDRE